MTQNPYYYVFGPFRSQASSDLEASLPFDFRENDLEDGSASTPISLEGDSSLFRSQGGGDLAAGIDSSVSGLEGNIIASSGDQFFSLDGGSLDTSLDPTGFSFDTEDQVSWYTEDEASLFS